MNLQDFELCAQIGYYTLLGLTPIGAGIGFYVHRKERKNRYSIQIVKEFQHKISPRIFHLRYHMLKHERQEIQKTSIQIVRYTFKQRINNPNAVKLALKSKSGLSQIK